MNGTIKMLSIIIPAFNEEATIHHILHKVRDVKLINDIQKEIIIVNDGSRDRTKEVIHRFMENSLDLEIQYHEHEVNRGKGAALHTAISKAKGEYLLIQDADLEYDPEDYNHLLKPIVEGYADVVYGSRFMSNKPHRVLFFWHKVGNQFLNSLSNLFTNLNLTDMETGYKLFNTQIIQSIALKDKRFGFEPEITAKISRIPNIRIYEVGISYYGRTFQEGKKIGWKDGMWAIWCILKYNIRVKKHG